MVKCTFQRNDELLRVDSREFGPESWVAVDKQGLAGAAK